MKLTNEQRKRAETLVGALLIASVIALFVSIVATDDRQDCPDGTISKRFNFCKNQSPARYDINLIK